MKLLPWPLSHHWRTAWLGVMHEDTWGVIIKCQWMAITLNSSLPTPVCLEVKSTAIIFPGSSVHPLNNGDWKSTSTQSSLEATILLWISIPQGECCPWCIVAIIIILGKLLQLSVGGWRRWKTGVMKARKIPAQWWGWILCRRTEQSVEGGKESAAWLWLEMCPKHPLLCCFQRGKGELTYISVCWCWRNVGNVGPCVRIRVFWFTTWLLTASILLLIIMVR